MVQDIFLNIFLCMPKSAEFYTFQSVNRSKGQARLDYILTKQANRRLISCVNVRGPALEAPKSDHILVYAKVRIPRRSGPNHRKRNITKETPKTADLRRLMADPNLRCQVANAIVASLPSISDGKPPVLSACPLHTNSGCGKERRILIGP